MSNLKFVKKLGIWSQNLRDTLFHKKESIL